MLTIPTDTYYFGQLEFSGQAGGIQQQSNNEITGSIIRIADCSIRVYYALSIKGQLKRKKMVNMFI